MLNLCRVYCFGHLANKIFAECHTKNTRQNKYTRQTVLCRVYYFWHSAKINVCRVYFFTLGKDFFAECIIFGTRQRLWFVECFFTLVKELNFFPLSTSKIFLLSTYNMCYSMLKFGTFLYLFAIFNLLTTFHTIFKLSQIWNAIDSNNGIQEKLYSCYLAQFEALPMKLNEISNILFKKYDN